MEISAIKYHKILSEYFSSKALYIDKLKSQTNIRKIVELPWQQIKSKNFNSLHQTLTDLDIFLSIFDRDHNELWRYWNEMPSTLRDFVDSYSKAIEIWRDKFGNTSRFERALNELAHFYYLNDKKEESSRLFEEVVNLAVKLYPQDDIRVAIRKANLAATLSYKQEFSKAESMFREVLDPYLNYFGINRYETWAIYVGIAVCHVKLGKSEGIIEINRCLNWFKNRYGDSDYNTINLVRNLADAMWLDGQLLESVRLFEEAFEGFSKILSPEHPDALECSLAEKQFLELNQLFNDAMIFEGKGDFESSLEKFSQIERQVFGINKKLLAVSMFGRAKALRALGFEGEAQIAATDSMIFAKDSNKDLVEPLEEFLSDEGKLPP